MKTIKRSYSSDIRKEDDPTQLIKDFMERHNITKYTINPDKSVDVDGDIYIEKEDLINKKLPFKFNKVNEYFDCSRCNLTSLEGCPEEVGKTFNCSYNKLTSLKGCPKKVDGGFYCSNNNLTSLEDCPKIVGGNFYCNNNQLTSLEGCPEKVGGSFYCGHNNLTSLEGCPEYVGGGFYCDDNKKQFTIKEVKQYCKVKGFIWV